MSSESESFGDRSTQDQTWKLGEEDIPSDVSGEDFPFGEEDTWMKLVEPGGADYTHYILYITVTSVFGGDLTN